MQETLLYSSVCLWRHVTLVACALCGLLFASGCTEDQPTLPPEDVCVEGTLECACDEDGQCQEGRCADDVCIACPEGTLRCPCDSGQSCTGELVCEDEVCVEPSCEAGTADCRCDEGACGEGLECMDNTCVESQCPTGSVDCPCDEGACAADLVCMNEVCRVCEPDTAGCPCDDQGACGEGLVCEQGACRDEVRCEDLACVAEQLCQEAADGADASCLEDCTEGFAWDPATSTCQLIPILPTCIPDAPESIAETCAQEQRLCVEDDVNGAACGECLEGFVDEEGACRALVTCPDLLCEGQNRECTAGEPGEDAVCGACLSGFLVEGEACVVDMRATCSEDPADAFSILADCQAQERFCVPNELGASCGECIENLVEDPRTGQCSTLDSFGECSSDDECPDTLRCLSLTPGADARCLPEPCGPEESFDLRTQVCTDRCGCDEEGLTGQPWPVTDWNGDCVCETEPGYFFNISTGQRSAELCDADEDGWVRRSAFVHLESEDEAVRINARCDLRSIQQFKFVNEWGQELEVSVAEITGGLSTIEELYETNENDDPEEVEERQDEPYGQRRFEASEVNSLTRACVAERADLNDNGISDLREHQRSAVEPARDWMAGFVAAGYFMELHTGYYQAPGDESQHGTYVITERSRCDENFPLGYNALDGDYWTSCSRRRSGEYDPAEPLGFDFQAFNCDSLGGACPVLEPPSRVGERGEVPAHGLCEEGVTALAVNGVWRGMNHASQFRCGQIIGDLDPVAEDWQVRRSDLYGEFSQDGHYHLNLCSLVGCGEDDPDCVASSPLGEGTNPRDANLVCESEAGITMRNPELLLGRVGFMSVRFQDYDEVTDYAGGCISESAEWFDLCPDYNPQTTVHQSNSNNFGELVCGCGFNFGGPECDLGCPEEQLHFGGTNLDTDGFCDEGYCVSNAETEGRSGYWMCGDFAATSYTSFTETAGAALEGEGSLQIGDQVFQGRFTVRGRIPVVGTDGTPMCAETDDEGNCTGLTVR